MFERGSVAVAQPSVNKIDGITEIQKIIALADAAHRAIAARAGAWMRSRPGASRALRDARAYIVR